MSAPSGRSRGTGAVTGWLGPVSERCLRLLVIAITLAGLVYLASMLGLVLMALALAVVLAAVLHPLVRRLEARGMGSALAASIVLGAALLLIAAAIAVIVPQAVSAVDELDVNLQGGIDVVQDWVAGGALGFSEREVTSFLERTEQELRDNAGRLTRGVLVGATLAVEVMAGLALAVVLLFFLLKDGRLMWRWLVALLPAEHRRDADEIGHRVMGTLGGYVRGVTLVAAFDAVFVALALLIVGVPLVVPLAVVTFVGAYIPILGAYFSGAAAVLVALVADGAVAALVIAGAVVVVQQLESNFFQPVVVGRSVQLHPVAILLAVTTGGVLAGIVGAVVGPPLVAVAAAALRYWRFERETVTETGIPAAAATPP